MEIPEITTRRRILGYISNYYIFFVVLLFWIIACSVTSSFATLENFYNILLLTTSVALVSLGQNYVILTGCFDLSVGAVISLATAMAATYMQMDLALAIFIVLLMGAAIGAFNGFGVTKLGIDSFIMTLGTMGIATGLALWYRPYPGGYIAPEFREVIFYDVGGFPLAPFLILIITAVIGEFILHKRNFGRMIYAVGGDERRARLLGINPEKVRLLVFTISGVTAALTGLYIAGMINCGDASVGDPYLFDSIIAVLMGGTSISGGKGTFRNTVGAAFLIASLGSFCNLLGINPWYTWVIKGLLIFIVVFAGVLKR